jgi:amino acid transporter
VFKLRRSSHIPPHGGADNPAAGAVPSLALRDQPRRALGFRDLVLFYVVTGISLRWIATAAAAGPRSLPMWLIAWLAFFVPLALSVLELSSRYPNEGGLYVWSKRAFGDFAGFISAWIYWTSNLPYFSAILYFAAGNALFIGAGRGSHLIGSRTYFIIFALLGLLLPTILNVRGLDLGKWLNNIGALGMWLPVLMAIVLGMVAWIRYGSATPFTLATLRPGSRLQDFSFWSAMTYAFGGVEAASFMGDEIREARRTIPRALLAGGALITLAYVLGTLFVLVAVPSSEINDLQGLVQAIARAAARLGWNVLTPVAASLITLSNVAAAGAYLAATARLPFVAGIDRFLPPVFGSLHPRWRTPHIALWTQSLCGMIFVFLGQAGTTVRGAYDALVRIGVVTYFVPYLFVFAALIRLQREPAAADVVRLPGGKATAHAVAGIGLASTGLAIALSLLPTTDEPHPGIVIAKVLGLTVLLFALGAGVYGLGRRKRAAAS